jgi:hypothetical protein
MLPRRALPAARQHLAHSFPINKMGSKPSLLSYLQRFNQKRRLHYKIDLLPRLSKESPAPRLQTATKVQRPGERIR